MLHKIATEATTRFSLVSTTRKKPTMAPISDLRRVTFAAQYVHNEALGYSAPVDVVRVRFIPNVSDYNRKERRQLWYSHEEVRTMKNQAYKAANLRRAEIYRQQQQQQQQEEQQEEQSCEPTTTSSEVRYSSDLRGLERLIQNDSTKLRQQCIQAVLNEQYRQRRLRHGIRIPGDIVPAGDECEHDECVRRLVTTRGDSIRTLMIAQKLARKDAAEVDEYLGRQRSDGDHAEDDRTHDDRDDRGNLSEPCSVARQQEGNEKMQQQPPPFAEALLFPIEKSKNPAESSFRTIDTFENFARSLLWDAMLRPLSVLRPGDPSVVPLS